MIGSRDDLYIQMYKMLHENIFNKSVCLTAITNLLKEIEYSDKKSNKEMYILLIYIFLKTPMCFRLVKTCPKFRKAISKKYNELIMEPGTSIEFNEYFKNLKI